MLRQFADRRLRTWGERDHTVRLATGHVTSVWANLVRRALTLAVTVLAVSIPVPTFAQATWSEPLAATSPPNPPLRSFSGIAYDPVYEQAIVFGGQGCGNVCGDTWFWDGTAWTQLFPVPPATWPSARSHHHLAYDGHNIILFGGADANFNDLGDTWAWDAANRNWVLKTQSGPSPRFDYAMAFDAANQKIVLFGGRNAAMSFSSDYYCVCAFNDTWLWDPQSGTWSQPSTSNPPPTARALSAMAYDGVHVVMYGGWNAYTYGDWFGDMWQWTGSDWLPLTISGSNPGARYSDGMAYDDGNQRVLLFGGYNGSGALNDTWKWDGTAWTNLSPATSPPRAGDLGMAFDSAHGQALLFGGSSSNPATGDLLDTWLYGTAAPTTQVTINVPAGLQFTFDGGTYTGSRTFALAQGTYSLFTGSPQVAGTGTRVLWASWSDGGANPHDVIVGSSAITITATFTTQYLLTTTVSPAGTGSIDTSPAGSFGFFDAGTVVGVTATAYPGATFTAWSGACSGGGACQVTMNAPMSVTATFSVTSVNVTINVPAGIQFMFNGSPYTGSQTFTVQPGVYSLSTPSPQLLGTDTQAVFVSWDDGGAETHQIVAPANVTATFKTQYRVTVQVAPAPENAGVVAGGNWYDAGTLATVTATPNTGSELYHWDTPVCCFHASEPSFSFTVTGPSALVAHFGIKQNWVQLFPTSSPDPRDGFALTSCYADTVSAPAVLFGGINKSGKTLGDTWVWDGTTWTAIATAPASTPSPRSGAAMAKSFEASSGNSGVVLFGGKDAKGAFLSDTWFWDCSAKTWTQWRPATIPPARGNAALEFDGGFVYNLIMFGGQDSAGFLGDTWRWDGTNWTQLQPPQSPAPRANATMDQAEFARPDIKTIYIGLATLSGGNGLVNGVAVNFSDIWHWDPTALNWVQQSSSTPPPNTTGPIATNVLKGQELLFGLNGATWGYDGLAWLKAASAVSPPARGGEGLAWNTLNLTNPQILLFGGHATASGTKLNDTWVWLTPSIGLTPQSVSITKSGSSYIVTMNLQDTGNVPDGTIAVTSATLSAAVAKSASTISLLNPGAAGSVTAKFPASSVGGISGVPVPVTFAGTYSANGVSGNQWVGTFVVILP